MWQTLLAADRALGARIAAALDTSPLASVFVWLSVIGARGGVWLTLGLATWLVAPAKRMAVWRLLLAIGLTALLVDGVIKPIVGRARPFADRPEVVLIGDRPDTASFPSGHAAIAATSAVALARAWPAASLPLWTLALSIAGSRLVLGVHFPLDVLAGLLLGYAVARFVCARAPHPDAPVGGAMSASA